jgi:hypothetical protein
VIIATFVTGLPWYSGDFQVCLTEVAAHEQTKAATAHRTSPRNLSVGMVMVAGTEARDRLERAHMGFSGF